MGNVKHQRMTRQRRIILEEVSRLKSHPTADEVYRIVRKRMPKVSLGTVYRNLDLLSESGVIGRLKTSGSQYQFDGNTEDHFHVRCVECGRIDDVEAVDIRMPETLVEESSGYQFVGYRLEFRGYCPTCRKRRQQGEQDNGGRNATHQ